MNPKRDSDLSALSGAYALDALAEPEKSDFEALMAESEQVRAEVTELVDTAVELGLSVTPEAPSADLRAKLMAQVAVTPQFAPLDAPEAPLRAPSEDDGQIHDVADADAPVTVGKAEARAQARWYQRPMGTLLAAAAAIALIVGVGGVSSLVIQGQNDMSTASQVNEIQAAGDYQRASVDIKGGGTATLVWSLSLQRSALIVDGLKGLPAGSTYELWYINEHGSTPAGTFDVGDNGNHSVVLAGAMSVGDTVGVTVEPAGGSTKPSNNPIIVLKTA
ncbi:anti-sigma factor [soil metagenome]